VERALRRAGGGHRGLPGVRHLAKVRVAGAGRPTGVTGAMRIQPVHGLFVGLVVVVEVESGLSRSIKRADDVGPESREDGQAKRAHKRERRAGDKRRQGVWMVSVRLGVVLRVAERQGVVMVMHYVRLGAMVVYEVSMHVVGAKLVMVTMERVLRVERVGVTSVMGEFLVLRVRVSLEAYEGPRWWAVVCKALPKRV
jgi:hypothetical protein